MFVDNHVVYTWFKEVSVPYWAKSYANCQCRAYKFSSKIFQELFVFEYKCEFMFDNFVVFCIHDDNHMFGAMKGIWKEIAKRFDITVDDDGRISDYGVYKVEQSEDGVAGFTRWLYELYNDWKPYENIDDYDTMVKAKSSKDAINKLKYELKNKGLEKDITEARKQIEELKEDLFNMENAMTKLYEDAAEAMNFLEEHGYPQEEIC